MPDVAKLRESLIQCAETVLRPSLAILLECAYEAERSEKAAGFLKGLIQRFYMCAEKGIPLSDGGYEVFDMFLPMPPGGADMLAVGLLSEETIRAESALKSAVSPGTDGFVKYITRRATAAGLAEFAPAILGVGIADNEDEARLLARMAMFRSPDRHSPDAVAAECERRILAAVNRGGPGAGGLGGDHTALAVSIEQTGRGFTALCPGNYFTRFASKKL